MNDNYEKKYLKYKTKYLSLRSQLEGDMHLPTDSKHKFKIGNDFDI